MGISAPFWMPFSLVIAFVAVISLLTVLVQRDMRRGGGGSAHGNPLGAMDEVFHPAAHRARLELQHVDEVAETVPSPDGDLPPGQSGVQLVRGADGTPRTARITRRR
ncbi:hypothetical protein ACLM5J_10090 [Nocardioides sp. Bht2]|uniref:hypothetical protein n=1 Tax=Nocardioides sp. Bht2 TaxID=3392297 RepID=UPI0039B62A6A